MKLASHYSNYSKWRGAPGIYAPFPPLLRLFGLRVVCPCERRCRFVSVDTTSANDMKTGTHTALLVERKQCYHLRPHSGNTLSAHDTGSQGGRQQRKLDPPDNSPFTWYMKGVRMNVPSTCQPVRPTPVHPSEASLDTRNMSGWGERGCCENVLSIFPSVAENSTFDGWNTVVNGMSGVLFFHFAHLPFARESLLAEK